MSKQRDSDFSQVRREFQVGEEAAEKRPPDRRGPSSDPRGEPEVSSTQMETLDAGDPGSQVLPGIPAPGDLLGRYLLVEKLGQGGMGLVFEAVDTSLDRKVAIKFLPADWVDSPQKVERFLREAKILASLDHPNIVLIHSVEEADSLPFIVMERIVGRSLREFLPEEGLPLRQLVEYAVPMADALAAAHAGGVAHRDLKPENVMIQPDGRVKVLDFGIAKRVQTDGGASDPEDSTDALTGDRVIGTPAYMSPEQLRSEPIGPASDVFSFGTLLYEMATGRRPFNGKTAIEVAGSILYETPPPPSSLVQLPEALDLLVADCLHKSARERPPTLTPVLDRLLELRRMLERSALEEMVRETRRAPGQDLSSRNSVAVAPFQDLTPGGDHGYFCIGIAEEIASELSRVPALRVAVASRMDRDSIDPIELGKLLGVSTVLDGSLQLSGDRMRISVRLASVANGSVLWSNRFDRPVADALSVQEEVAGEIARAFDTQLVPGRPSGRSSNREAYFAYLRGRYFWGRRYEDGLRRALEWFDQAISLDPGMAEAHAGRADCFVILGHYGLMNPETAYDTARESVERALDLSPDLAEAHATLGWIAAFYDWSRKVASEAFARSLELDPNYATALEWNGIHLLSSGSPNDALASLRRAQSADPLSLMIGTILGWTHLEMHNDDEARRTLENVLEMEPNFVFAYNVLGTALVFGGEPRRAVRLLERAAELSNREGLTLGFLGLVYGLAGQEDDVDGILTELSDPGPKRVAAHTHLALPLVGAGRYDRALAELELAVAARESFFPSIHHSRIFDPLRAEARFQTLLRQLGV